MTDYPYIRAWGAMMGSRRYYISDETRRAQQDNAPANAIYHSPDPEGKRAWITLDDCPLNVQDHLGTIVDGSR